MRSVRSAEPPRTLARLVDQLGGSVLEALTGTIPSGQPVEGIVIWDSADTLSSFRHAVVLGVGIHEDPPMREVLTRLGEAGSTALIVRTRPTVMAETRRLAQRVGVTLLGLVDGITWAQAAAMLRSVLSAGDDADLARQLVGGLPSDDLFALSNAIADLLNAPVTIEDRQSNVIAFSGRQDEADAARIATVLGRRVPEQYISAHKSRGEFDRIYRSSKPVYVPPWDLGGEQSLPRVAVAIRAGEEVLGSMWAVTRGVLDPDRTQAFADAAKVAALHMLRLRAGSDLERRLRADLLNTALSGGPAAIEAAARLGIAGHPAIVLALSLLPRTVRASTARGPAEAAAELQRTADALFLHLTALQPGSTVATLGDVVYAVVPQHGSASSPEARACKVAEAFLGRIAPGTAAVIGVGPTARNTSDLVASRRGASRALRVLQHAGAARGSRVALSTEVHFDALILELRDLAAANGDAVVGPIARLQAYDAEHRSDLLLTLRCWLDSFGDIQAAARRAIVHPNTLRYRMRRVAEVAGLDLADPDQRFAAMLQLRLIASPTVGDPPVESAHDSA